MRPKWIPNAPQRVPWRPLGAESGFSMLFGVILDPPKSSKMELKFDQKSSADLELSFGLFESLWSIWGSFWAPFWAPGRVMPFLQKVAPRHSESTIFRGLWGQRWVQHGPQNSFQRQPGSKSVLGASRARFSSILGFILGLPNRSK